MAQRLLVIGLDGVDPTLALQWAREGRLPVLQRLLADGAGGQLGSVPAPTCLAAWNSLATGLNPGRHGIFGMLDRTPGTYELERSDSRRREGATFWRLLGDAGLQVAALHVPAIYPAEAVNGIEVSGWLAASVAASGYTAPAELADDIRREFPDFSLHTHIDDYLNRGRYDLVLEAKLAALRTRGRLDRWLWQREKWDCFITTISEPDAVSHFFWHFMEPTHPEHEEHAHRFDEAVFDIYRAADEEIGRLLDLAGGDVRVMVLSDHGFGVHSNGPLYLKGLLRAMGLEVPRDPAQKGRSGALARVLRTARRMTPRILREQVMASFPRLVARLQRMHAEADIDYARSRAYTLFTGKSADIWLNVRGRDPLGVVAPGEEYDTLAAQLAEALLLATELRSGQPVVERVERREELYHGPHVERAPDLLITWSDEVITSGIRTLFDGREVVVDTPFEEKVFWGQHRRQGFIAAAGPGAGTVPEGASIYDIAPTVLDLFGVKPPTELDGRVLEGLFHSADAAPDESAPAPSDSTTPPDMAQRIRELYDDR